MTYRVLIVEDNLDQSDLIKLSLERSALTFESDFASSGQEALSRCQQQSYDIIILDYKLPDVSGIEVLTGLREQKVSTPVIIVTGHGDERIAVEAMKSGAADYIVKDESYLKTLPKTIASIVDRFRLQQRLKEKEDFLANVVENANDIIFSLDQNFNFRFVNPKVKKLKYDRDELIGKSFYTILARKHQPDLQSQILKYLEERNFELEFKDKNDKSYYNIVSFTRLVRNGGSEDHILGIAKDVTKTLQLHRLIQESKKKLQTLFDSITDYIVVLDKDKNIVMANKKMASLQNTSPNRILGKKCYSLFSETPFECEGCIVDITWKTLQPEQLERTRNDKIFQMWTYPMFNLDGELEYVIEYSRDVTEQKSFERKLIQAEKLATIGLLASGVAHELRNPLNIIETARYYLQDVLKDKDENLESKLHIIKRNVIRASNIINNLLEFSRHSQKDRELIDVNLIIDKTLSLIDKDLRSQNIVVTKIYKDIPKAFLNIDSLKQVFLNIIINAVHAMPEGGELTIETQYFEDKWINVKFMDTGTGISKENLNNIFTPFFTTKELGKGTGLGMYVSHSIIKRERGDIQVESVEGKGTTFTVLLPIKN